MATTILQTQYLISQPQIEILTAGQIQKQDAKPKRTES